MIGDGEREEDIVKEFVEQYDICNLKIGEYSILERKVSEEKGKINYAGADIDED